MLLFIWIANDEIVEPSVRMYDADMYNASRETKHRPFLRIKDPAKSTGPADGNNLWPIAFAQRGEKKPGLYGRVMT